jgi:hypothetical protein
MRCSPGSAAVVTCGIDCVGLLPRPGTSGGYLLSEVENEQRTIEIAAHRRDQKWGAVEVGAIMRHPGTAM